MFTAIFGSLELGVIYAIMALGVYLSFRIVDFPDLTVDGSFVTGAAVAAALMISGVNPFLATIMASAIGFLAGCITGILHTFGKINALLSGILMMIALYSINLRIMGKSNIPLLNEETIFTSLLSFWDKLGIDGMLSSILTAVGLGENIPKTWGILFLMLLLTFFIKFTTDWFLKTEVGLALRATGDNQKMIRSLSANTNLLIILGLGISNSLVALSGSLVAQYGGFADVGMGIGMIIIGLASVIIGEAIIGTKTIVRTTLAVIVGAILYRLVVTLALRVDFLETGDMKLITATIVIIALILPKIIDRHKEKMRKAMKRQERLNDLQALGEGSEEHNASVKRAL
ncbi:ABC transporter permease [Bacillus coahuilensis]|uniref:ABC transporter permease n=1 Tax=Bacillus coahuilensis TaxID=408580 RepID=UPI0001850B8F|nr:ABC transporter permease [Bacillus coahuilensis]